MRSAAHHQITAADRRAAARFVRNIRRLPGAAARYTSVDALVRGCEPLIGEVRIIAQSHDQWIDDPGTLMTGVSFLRGPASTDVILIRGDMFGRHRTHVVAHELGHLLGRDYAGQRPNDSVRDCANGHQGTDDFQASLETPEERRAEAFAELACTRLVVSSGVAARRRFDWAQ